MYKVVPNGIRYPQALGAETKLEGVLKGVEMSWREMRR